MKFSADQNATGTFDASKPQQAAKAVMLRESVGRTAWNAVDSLGDVYGFSFNLNSCK